MKVKTFCKAEFRFPEIACPPMNSSLGKTLPNTGTESVGIFFFFFFSNSKFNLVSGSQIFFFFFFNWSEVNVAQSCPTRCNPKNYTVHGILQARILEWVAFPFSRGSSQPRIKPRSHALQADSLPAEPQGKPKNTGVGSLYLLQWIFPTEESNQCLLYYRWILYQLSYQGNLFIEVSWFTLPC